MNHIIFCRLLIFHHATRRSSQIFNIKPDFVAFFLSRLRNKARVSEESNMNPLPILGMRSLSTLKIWITVYVLKYFQITCFPSFFGRFIFFQVSGSGFRFKFSGKRNSKEIIKNFDWKNSPRFILWKPWKRSPNHRDAHWKAVLQHQCLAFSNSIWSLNKMILYDYIINKIS